MSKQQRELKKNYCAIIDDIFDHFDEYSDEEKDTIKKELDNLNAINNIVEKYDKKNRFSAVWTILQEWWNNSTGKNK